MVISNSIVHHLPNPLPFFLEIKRVLKPNGAIFTRDLFWFTDKATRNALVDSSGEDYDEHQKMLFRDSLHAAFTLNEVKKIVQDAGLEGVKVYQALELHWTAERKYSEDVLKVEASQKLRDSSDPDLNHRYVDKSFGSFHKPFIIFAQALTSVEPSKCSLNHPPFW